MGRPHKDRCAAVHSVSRRDALGRPRHEADRAARHRTTGTSTTPGSRKIIVDRIEIDADTEPVDQYTSTSENHTTGGAA
jgi:hypothetical protein